MTVAFRMTVIYADGSEAAGTCTEGEAARSLRTAVRRGYFVEVLPAGGANIGRPAGAGLHWVKLAPMRRAGKLTATVRMDLGLVGLRGGVLDPGTGRIKAGYISSIPPGAAARLLARGLVTVTGTSVAVSLSARLAALAQDHRPAPWSYEPTTAELAGLCTDYAACLAAEQEEQA